MVTTIVWQGKKHNVSKSTIQNTSKRYPTIRSLALLPFPLWGVHKQSTCLLFAENLNTVKMTEKTGLLVTTLLAAEIPFKWTLCCLPANYTIGLEDWFRKLGSALAACWSTSLASWSAVNTELCNITISFKNMIFRFEACSGSLHSFGVLELASSHSFCCASGVK